MELRRFALVAYGGKVSHEINMAPGLKQRAVLKGRTPNN